MDNFWEVEKLIKKVEKRYKAN